MNTNTKWIVVANNVTAKIYASHSKIIKNLTLITELEHPDGAKMEHDLVSNRPGHYQTNNASGGSYEEHDAKEIGNDTFAKQIAEHLEQGRNAHQFQSIMLVVPSHLLGLLEKHFTKSIKLLIDKIIQKNLVFTTQLELEKILAEIE